MYLLEVEEAAAYILRRTAGSTVEDYLNDEDLRFAIERNFILIGEAMVLLRRHFPDVSAEIEVQGKIINSGTSSCIITGTSTMKVSGQLLPKMLFH